MQNLPIRIVRHIQSFGMTRYQVLLCITCKRFKNELSITTLDDEVTDDIFITILHYFHTNISIINKGEKLSNAILSLIKPKILYLKLGAEYAVDDKLISHMDLYELIIPSNNGITDKGIMMNSNLKKLYTSCNLHVTDKSVCNLDLFVLAASNNPNITNRSLENNKNLKVLGVSPCMTYSAISKLPDLTELLLGDEYKVTGDEINKLKQLKLLRLTYCKNMEKLQLTELPKLTDLIIDSRHESHSQKDIIFFKNILTSDLKITKFGSDSIELITHAAKKLNHLEKIQFQLVDNVSAKSVINVYKIIDERVANGEIKRPVIYHI